MNMDAGKIIRTATTDLIVGNITEVEFVDRLRLIVSPSPNVTECIKSCDTLIQCINNVEDTSSTDRSSVLDDMVSLVIKNQGDDSDHERDHKEADDLLLNRLVQLNETLIVKEYLKIKKWYA